MLQEQGSSMRRILLLEVSHCKCWYRLHNEKVYWMLITFPSYMFSHCIIIGNDISFHTRRLSQTGGWVDEICVGFRRPAFAVVFHFQMNWKLKKKKNFSLVHRNVRCHTEETGHLCLICNDFISRTQRIVNNEGIISLTYINIIITYWSNLLLRITYKFPCPKPS